MEMSRKKMQRVPANWSYLIVEKFEQHIHEPNSFKCEKLIKLYNIKERASNTLERPNDIVKVR
jgi:uncharacterized FlgJ-related protein